VILMSMVVIITMIRCMARDNHEDNVIMVVVELSCDNGNVMVAM
jgi:hypothetical protein